MSVPPPPPPGTRPPPPPGEWGQPPSAEFRVGDAMSYGWYTYWQNLGPLLALALVIFAVNVVIALVGTAVDDLASQVVLNIISFLVGIVLAMGLIRGALAVVEGRAPEVQMFLETDGFGAYLVASILFGLGVALGVLALIVPGIILAIMWQFFGYVIVQSPTTGATAAMGRSADITRGHRWQLLGLGLLLILLNIAGMLACGIGVIFTYGITAVTLAYTYKTLSGQPVVPPPV